ncbi:MAG: hypothetical protein ACO1SV_12465 [Fimbriimonas sp.]
MTPAQVEAPAKRLRDFIAEDTGMPMTLAIEEEAHALRFFRALIIADGKAKKRNGQSSQTIHHDDGAAN